MQIVEMTGVDVKLLDVTVHATSTTGRLVHTL